MVSALHCPTIYLLDITNDCALGLQNQALSSPDGRVYLLVQGDGNLVLYSAQVANLFGQSFASAIFATRHTQMAPRPAPSPWSCSRYDCSIPPSHTRSRSGSLLSLGTFHQPLQAQHSSPCAAALQDCNLVLLNANSQSIYQSGTTNQGTGPCQLVVSGAGGGGFAVIDSNNATLYSQGAYSPPGTVPGTLPSNAVLTQVSLTLGGFCVLGWSILPMESGKRMGPLLRRTPSSFHWTGPCASSPSLMVRFLSLVAMLHAGLLCQACEEAAISWDHDCPKGVDGWRCGRHCASILLCIPIKQLQSALHSRQRCALQRGPAGPVRVRHRGSRRLGLQHVQQHDGEDERPAPAVQARHAIGEPRHPAAQRHHRPSLFS